jgi:hypothetical protein
MKFHGSSAGLKQHTGHRDIRSRKHDRQSARGPDNRPIDDDFEEAGDEEAEGEGDMPGGEGPNADSDEADDADSDNANPDEK